MDWLCEDDLKNPFCEQRLLVDDFYIGEGTDSTGVPTNLVTSNLSLVLHVYNSAPTFGIHVSSGPINLMYSEIAISTGRVKITNDLIRIFNFIKFTPISKKEISLFCHSWFHFPDEKVLPIAKEPSQCLRTVAWGEDTSLWSRIGNCTFKWRRTSPTPVRFQRYNEGICSRQIGQDNTSQDYFLQIWCGFCQNKVYQDIEEHMHVHLKQFFVQFFPLSFHSLSFSILQFPLFMSLYKCYSISYSDHPITNL